MLDEVASKVVCQCLNIKSGERVIIITDQLREKIGRAIFNAAAKITESLLLLVPVGKIDGKEPPQGVAELIRIFDVIIAPTTYSLSHTNAIIEARKRGARVATLPGITEEMFLRAVNIDYAQLHEITNSVADRFSGAKTIKVTSRGGTDIEFSIAGRNACRLDGLAQKSGDLINLPDGEVAFAPVEGTANGIIVVDGSMSPDQDTGNGAIRKIRQPIKLNILNGKVTAICGAKQAELLKKIIAGADENANLLGEFGIGTNTNALLTGEVLEDEKVFGTVHFALGTNKSFGGNVQSNIHLDGVILAPRLFIDSKELDFKLIGLDKAF